VVVLNRALCPNAELLEAVVLQYNATFGHNAGRDITTGDYNVAIGGQALRESNVTSATAVGYYALGATSGSCNTGLGYFAGCTLTTGTNNVILGYNAQPSSATVSNEFTLGNSSITNLRCNDQTISALSDGRDKIEVEDLPLGMEFLKTLRPVKFKWETREGSTKDGTYEAGFIAQELLAATEEAGVKDYLPLVYESNPDRLEAAYAKLLPVVVQALKDIDARLAALEGA